MHNLDRTAVVIAAAATGTAAVLVFALLPVLSGVMADQFQLDDVQTGLVATSYFSVYALMALSSSTWIRRFNWVKTARTGYAIMLLGLLVTLIAPSFVVASSGLALVGAGAGLLFPISLTLVSDMTHTDRVYAIKIAAEQLVPAGLLFLLSSSLFAVAGLSTTLIALIAVVSVCFFMSLQLPAEGNVAKHSSSEKGDRLSLGIASLVALSIGFAGFAGLWAFLERIAVDNAFEPGFTNTWLAVGLITSGVGPIAAAVLEDRLGRILPMALATAVAMATLVLLARSNSTTAYALVLTILPLSYYFAITYMFGVVADADSNGRIAGLMSFALAVGAGSGPAIFGLLKAADGAVILGMSLLILLGAGMMIAIQFFLQKHKTGVTA
ncbi:MAG: MFS transporter [Gammaproteobacteria bacterium]|nr:MFS transporter [Gammaproteobacteria bacterium]